MAPRGPDGSGSWISPDGRVGLAHRRLSILDLSEAGAQPMASADGNLHIVFNGEIYNFRKLQKELEQQGTVFRSRSDTEVLLHLYAREGEAMLGRLRGMFAFAIWDARKRELFLARDPHGIKPLYTADDGRTFRAASQVKALLTGGGIDTRPEPAGQAGYFLWGHVPEPYTLYRGIRSLPAGSWMRVRENGLETGRFWDWGNTLRQAGLAGQAADLRDAVGDSVRAHLVSDVPVGVFLSAGIDSNVLAAHAAEAGGKLRSLTLSFAEYAGTERDEGPLAAESARRLGLEHTDVRIERKEFAGQVERLLDQMDQPTNDGTNVYFVSWAAHRAGMKVALSGLGGDELFGGYPSFRLIPRSVAMLGWSRLVPGVGPAFRMVTAPWLGAVTSPKYAGLLDFGGTRGGAYFLRRGMFMPWELPGLMDAELARQGVEELGIPESLNRGVGGITGGNAVVSWLESVYYMRNQLLRDADWAGMAHSLEIRVPLVDRVLSENLAPAIRSGYPPTKKDIAASSPKALPPEMIHRPKSGFQIPVREWLAESAGIQERGLRGWVKFVYDQYTGKN
jgi:asparagine synthase (glutamine-hydrolysing)